MSKLAILGGKPVSKKCLATSQLRFRPDLERKYLLQTYDSGIWDDWPGVKDSAAARFEKEWAAFNKSKFCALLTNGTHALQVALETLDIGVGDEVIVPGLTWQATASAVCDVNATPILVDVDPETMCIDPKKAEAAITRRTRAIIPVHLYHRMADMDAILRIARRHNLRVIEDSAHTHGSRWDGRGAGSLGDRASVGDRARDRLLQQHADPALERIERRLDMFVLAGRHADAVGSCVVDEGAPGRVDGVGSVAVR
jgi:L-glutamine:2-deoxy-scyllo-inosose/3-amino-2,3-dideoxy-scyllo-inosose aminotransferase